MHDARRLDSITLVMFDLAGTTVDDRAAGSSLVVEALVRAFAEANVDIDVEGVHRHRGKEKREAIRRIWAERRSGTLPDPAVEASIYADFVTEVRRKLGQMSEIEGTAATFRFLKDRGIHVAVGSGFPMDIVDDIVSTLGWRGAGLVDYVGSAESVGAGRPDPVMIRDAMSCCGITDPTHVLKVGDTVADVQEGRNAGTWTAGVLTGSQSAEQLRSAGADFILPSVSAVPSLFS